VSDDDFKAMIQQQIINAFRLTPEQVEEMYSTEPGSYGAAHLEYEGRHERFMASLPARMRRAADSATAQMYADHPDLPEGLRFVVDCG
jgi:hypothetical protein